jgi:hypothetical protein
VHFDFRGGKVTKNAERERHIWVFMANTAYFKQYKAGLQNGTFSGNLN